MHIKIPEEFELRLSKVMQKEEALPEEVLRTALNFYLNVHEKLAVRDNQELALIHHDRVIDQIDFPRPKKLSCRR